MENIFRKDSPIFDGENCDIWKEKMKTHLLYMGLGQWIVMKGKNKIVE